MKHMIYYNNVLHWWDFIKLKVLTTTLTEKDFNTEN